jgi:hypothetical protein
MLPRFLLGSDDDWIENVRLWLYPRLHPILERYGGYGIGGVGNRQYVGFFDEDEEVIEEEMEAAGGRRNPIACLKSLSDGRVSEGSWAFLAEDDPTGVIEPGMQVHITLFDREDGEPGRELYAHYEDDWRTSPRSHLKETNFDIQQGVEIATELIDEHTYLIRL